MQIIMANLSNDANLSIVYELRTKVFTAAFDSFPHHFICCRA